MILLVFNFWIFYFIFIYYSINIRKYYEHNFLIHIIIFILIHVHMCVNLYLLYFIIFSEDIDHLSFPLYFFLLFLNCNSHFLDIFEDF